MMRQSWVKDPHLNFCRLNLQMLVCSANGLCTALQKIWQSRLSALRISADANWRGINVGWSMPGEFDARSNSSAQEEFTMTW